LRDREESFDGALAVLGLAAEGELAVDDRAAQAALGGVVGRLDAVELVEGPERRPDLEQVIGEGAGVLVASTLLRVSLPSLPTSSETVLVRLLVNPEGEIGVGDGGVREG
jgi:hypothetical protein